MYFKRKKTKYMYTGCDHNGTYLEMINNKLLRITLNTTRQNKSWVKK